MLKKIKRVILFINTMLVKETDQDQGHFGRNRLSQLNGVMYEF